MCYKERKLVDFKILNETFLDRWIARDGLIPRQPRFPALKPLDYFLRGNV